MASDYLPSANNRDLAPNLLKLALRPCVRMHMQYLTGGEEEKLDSVLRETSQFDPPATGVQGMKEQAPTLTCIAMIEGRHLYWNRPSQT